MEMEFLPWNIVSLCFDSQSAIYWSIKHWEMLVQVPHMSTFGLCSAIAIAAAQASLYSMPALRADFTRLFWIPQNYSLAKKHGVLMLPSKVWECTQCTKVEKQGANMWDKKRQCSAWYASHTQGPSSPCHKEFVSGSSIGCTPPSQSNPNCSDVSFSHLLINKALRNACWGPMCEHIQPMQHNYNWGWSVKFLPCTWMGCWPYAIDLNTYKQLTQ